MPVPGQPRNPFGQTSRRFVLERPRAIGYGDGGSPAHFAARTLRGMILAGGQLRYLWKQKVAYTPGPPPFSTTANRAVGSVSTARGFQLTRALRYMTRSLYMGAGSDSTRLSELHSSIGMRARSKAVTVGAGQQRGKPVTRNRLTSFGSRVTPMQQRPNGGTK